MTGDDVQPDLLVGGMDAGIEHLLLDAGGRWLEAPAPEEEESLGPWVGFAFGAARRPDMDLTARVCRDHGWPVRDDEVRTSTTTLWVQEVVAVRLLARLARSEAAPDALVVDTAVLLPAQVRGLREALPVGTSLLTTDGSGHTNRP